MTPISNSLAAPTECDICLQLKPENLVQRCSCGDTICDSCPGFACSCVDDDPVWESLRLELRTAAQELKALEAERGLMGPERLTLDQQSRLALLGAIVSSLTAELCRMEEARWGEVYEDDPEWDRIQRGDTLGHLEAEK